jgi:uncharacterized membrane protein YadS
LLGRGILPDLAFSALVAIVAAAAAPLIGRVVPIPAMVVALLIGIVLNPLARRPLFQPGISLCPKTLLRWAVALLGLRIALGEIAALGLTTALCASLGFDPQTTGVMLGATIHDVAQVVGAGYAVSEPVGNTAVIVKLFRVFLLFPVVLTIGRGFAQRSVASEAARIPFPVFALVLVALCVINSIASAVVPVAPAFALIKAPLIEASTWGLLIAIGALGLGASLPAITARGWRHVASVTGATVVILVVVTAGSLILR